MQQYCLVILAVIACASASTVQDANAYMDLVLEQHMPRLVLGNHDLFPGARIPDFHFKILKTAITNRDLKANISDGWIHGFDTGVHRLGNCEQPILLSGNTTVNCVLNMTGIGATLTATTKGDSLVGTIKTIWVNVTLKKETVLKVAVTAQHPKPASLMTFFMERLKLKTKYDDHLSLNDDREDQFEELIEEKVRDVLISAIYNPYKAMFETAVQMATPAFPRA
ncbi:salivary anticoagulant protein P23-like [Dermacentor variabilis]|uniref:salivary anticoagulant protein P23-like n=1 Tax=Dermacentor variabilis TaxID=34621 RepID=UPI003F5AFFB8